MTALLGRSRFALVFFQLLRWGEVRAQIQGALRSDSATRFGHSRESFYHSRFPLLSQRVFHL